MHRIGIALLALVSSGCVTVDSMKYRGVQDWPTGSAFVRVVEGIEVYEGLPDRPYAVLGLIDVYYDRPFYLNDGARAKVAKTAKEWNSDALVLLSDRAIASGSHKFGTQAQDPAQLQSGRSSQPELVVVEVSGNERQQTLTSYRKILRSTLLAVKWK